MDGADEHVDWNLKKLGKLFHVLMQYLQKSPQTTVMVTTPWWNLGSFYVSGKLLTYPYQGQHFALSEK